jgi:hypothetical protein
LAAEDCVDATVVSSIETSSEVVNSDAVFAIDKSDREIRKTPRFIVVILIEGRIE